MQNFEYFSTHEKKEKENLTKIHESVVGDFRITNLTKSKLKNHDFSLQVIYHT